jgi:hypothetical protein
MIKLLIAKSGKQENPVTKSQELEVDDLKPIIGNRKLRYLGPLADELPPLGQPSKVDGFKGSDCVVILVPKIEASSLNCSDSDFYLVDGLRPSELK